MSGTRKSDIWLSYTQSRVRTLKLFVALHGSTAACNSLSSHLSFLLQNKKKKAAAPAANACGVHLFCQGGRIPNPSTNPVLNSNKAVKHRQQTSPVTVAVQDMYQGKVMPYGEIMPHGGSFNTHRTGDAELRANDRHYDEGVLQDLREAAEVHRQVRSDFMRWVAPGKSMLECAAYIESGVKAGLKAEKTPRLERGWGFPTGLSVNHVAAHYSPNSKDVQVLRQGDVMKVDFGVHIKGQIIDCAFTLAFEEKFDPLLHAVKEATNAGFKAAGVDVRLCDIGGEIEEVMQSHEIELNGVTYPIKCIRNLNGHNIAPFKIHGGKVSSAATGMLPRSQLPDSALITSPPLFFCPCSPFPLYATRTRRRWRRVSSTRSRRSARRGAVTFSKTASAATT